MKLQYLVPPSTVASGGGSSVTAEYQINTASTHLSAAQAGAQELGAVTAGAMQHPEV